MKVRDVIKLIEVDGWRLHSQQGSHRQYNTFQRQGELQLPANLAMIRTRRRSRAF
jgi:predicted RNA binding protein YcfA (HicA-like mRNA interferase family)